MILRPHIFQPQRLDGESADAYHERRAEANAWSPLGTSRYPVNFNGQHTNPRRALRRSLKRDVGNRQWRRAVLKAYKLKAQRLLAENAPA